MLDRLKLDDYPQPEYIRLRYPVLLCHGFGSVVSVIKPTQLHDVCMHFRTHGVPAFAPNTIPYAAIRERASDWCRHIDHVLSLTGAEKLNVVAHSMGGLDLRYCLSKLGYAPKVATLTTVATPHRGSSLAEVGLQTPSVLFDLFSAFFDELGLRMYPSQPSDMAAAMRDMTRGTMLDHFNYEVADHPDVAYFSWTAAVGKGTEDAIHPLLVPHNRHIYEQEGPNDGYVSVESALWGTCLGQVGLSHVEQLNVGLMRTHRERWPLFWTRVLQSLREAGF